MPSDPTLKSKWYEAVRDANDCECPNNGFVCSLHFSQENFETIAGKIQLKKGAVPTEFWVDINYEFENEVADGDTQEMEANLQVEYDQLQQLYLKNQLNFNVREEELLNKNLDLKETVQLQAKELSALKTALVSCQKLIDQMKCELVEAKVQTNITVSYKIIFVFDDTMTTSREDRHS